MDVWTLIWTALPYIRIISLLLFFEGIFLAVLRWMRPALKPESPLHHTEVHRVPWSRKTVVALKAVAVYLILGGLIYKRSLLRWIMHTCILFSSIALLILHVFPRVFLSTTEQSLFPGVPTWAWPIIYNILFAVFMVGIAIAFARGAFQKDVPEVSHSVYDFLQFILLLTAVVAGFALVNIELLGWQFYYDDLYLIHSITAYATIAFIPYGMFIHILAAPIATLAHAFYEARVMERSD